MISMDSSSLAPHRRYNPLLDEWVVVSPQRLQRPWQGEETAPATEPLPAYDPSCYLCPGNIRANGEVNPDYTNVHVFANDFPSLLPDPASFTSDFSPLFRKEEVRGECRVLCFSPDHNRSLSQMQTDEIIPVVREWIAQTKELQTKYQWVQIFENRGEMMGCSNPHPHCQIWAMDTLPSIPEREDRTQQRYYEDRHWPLLLDYATEEKERKERLLLTRGDWIAVVPFWAVWPYELLLLPTVQINSITDLTEKQIHDFASLLRETLHACDRLFDAPFPYSMGLHGAPYCTRSPFHWQFHVHIFPPLLRNASIRKHMVGFEMFGEPQRDLTAEQAAKRLKKILQDEMTA